MTTDQYIGEQVHMLQWRNQVPSTTLTTTLSRKLLGHTSVATTQNYVGVTSDVLRASVDAASIAHSLPGQRQGCAGPTVSTIEGV